LSKALEKARNRFQAGRYKQAVSMLPEVARTADPPAEEANGLLELAGALRDRTDGDLRTACEAQIRRAQKLLETDEQRQAAQRAEQLQAELKQDPARLARWAHDAGLGWLELKSPESVVAVSVRKAMAAYAAGRPVAPEPCLIDIVEAEGWRLESVVHRFIPARVQTSFLRGADFLSGDPVQGDEKYLYLFRRVEGAPGDSREA
jgi:hypothetical protein